MICVGLLIGSTLDAESNAQDRRQDKTRLRVVQYNVEFFFLDHSTGGIPCPGACRVNGYGSRGCRAPSLTGDPMISDDRSTDSLTLIHS